MYWDPFEEMNRMHEEIDRMFSRVFREYEKPMLEHKGKDGKELSLWKGTRAPMCHIQETESSVITAFELSGVNKADINLNVDDEFIELKVESAKEIKKEEKEGRFYSMSSQSFYRRLPFPKPVDSGKATAEYKNGILRVEAPKKHSEKKGKRLGIK